MTTINCDMGEGFGRYQVADDAALMPHIDLANVACGFHASDPSIMLATVDLALRHGVQIGAHPSLPDLQGFGRREMAIAPSDLAALLRYQVGALSGMLAGQSVRLHHIKPHGALYGMACQQTTVANAIADVALAFDLPVLGLAGSVQEEVYAQRGVELIPEFYADLDYDDDGELIIVAQPAAQTVEAAVTRAVSAIATGQTTSLSGGTIAVRAQTVCVHSDNRNALALVKGLRARLRGTAAAR